MTGRQTGRYKQVGRQAHIKTGRQADAQTQRKTDSQIGKQTHADWCVDMAAYRQKNRQTDMTHTDLQMGRNKDRLSDRKTRGQEDRQTDRMTCRQTDHACA